MYLSQLALQNFRNYARQELRLEPGVYLVQGANAQGKTNLLEAIYLLATTRAVRGGDADLIRWGAAAEGFNAARVQGQAERIAGAVTVEIVVAGRDEGAANGVVEHATKRLKLNGVPRRASDVIGQIAAVLFTAADIELITGPPAGRRRYLDIMISQSETAYVRALQRYTHVLTQRNHLLRRIDEGHAKVDELGFWDEELAREGAKIMHVRQGTMQALCIAARDLHARLSSDSEDLQITYAPQMPLTEAATTSTQEIEHGLSAALVRARRRDVASGVTTVGPHRDDLRFVLNGVPIASFGSRAQQRTAALALRLAETAFLNAADHDAPILLLDDILSELDAARRNAVIDLFAGAQQVFITTAEPQRFREAGLRASAVLEIEAGNVRREAWA